MREYIVIYIPGILLQWLARYEAHYVYVRDRRSTSESNHYVQVGRRSRRWHAPSLKLQEFHSLLQQCTIITANR
jgi:hypothetical protein